MSSLQVRYPNRWDTRGGVALGGGATKEDQDSSGLGGRGGGLNPLQLYQVWLAKAGVNKVKVCQV